MIEIGIATTGMRVARKLFRKSEDHQHDEADGDEERVRDLVDRLLDEERRVVGDVEPHAGGDGAPAGRAAPCAPRAATSTVLAFDCLTMPRPTAGSPLKRATVRSSSAPTVDLGDVAEAHDVVAAAA